TAFDAALAQEYVRTGLRLQHVREVLAAHGGLVLRDDVLLPKEALADLGGERGLARAIDRRRIAARIVHLGGGAEGFGRLGGDFAYPALGERARFGLERAHRADELDVVRDDIEHA